MIKSVGVIGAGQMGSGIAHVCALSGCDVLMQDINEAVLDQAVATIGKNMDRQVQREIITADQWWFDRDALRALIPDEEVTEPA